MKSKDREGKMIQIERMINRIEFIWKKFPELRLFQLLGNCLEPGDHYYIKDNELEEGLNNFYEKGK